MSKNVERFHEFIDYLKNGKFMEALEEFYAEDCVMQENLNPPTEGKDANRKREEDFMASVKEWTHFNITGAAVEGDVAFYESDFGAITHDGQTLTYQQVTRQFWEDGLIKHERFYYDASGGGE